MATALNQLLDVNFTDARFTGSSTSSVVGDYRDENKLDTALAAAQPSTYTAGVLATMTTNDKVYAVRMLSDLLSFGTPGTTTGIQ